MISRLLKIRLFTIIALASLSALTSCSDSDQYLYDDEDMVALQVHAEMARTFEIDSARVKADTITSKDTIVFIGEITPSRQAHYREYYWTLDGEDFSNDMNFRKPVTKAGYHQVCFVVTDYFGDTLRDTLHLWVTNPPVIEPWGFIPAIGSQGLSPKEGIHFAWHGYDPDSISKVYYRFEIQEPRGIRYTDDRHPKLYTVGHSILDTLIETPHFTYWDNSNFYHRLENLKFYTWEVRAINEFGLESDTVVQGNFFTKGNRNEGGIQAFIRFSNESLYDKYSHNGKIHLDILDSLSNPVIEREMELDTNQVVVSPLKPGKYRIIASLSKLTDFSTDTADVVVLPGEIAIADTLRLLDTIPPSNKYLTPEGLVQDVDTLDFKDTLRFYFEEHGGNFYQNFFWNGQELRGASFFREISYNEDRTADTVFLVLPKTYKSWTYQLLSISAYDYSGNLNSKTYVIRPSLERPEPEGGKDE